MTRTILACVFGLVLVACSGGDDAGDDVIEGDPVAIDQIGEELGGVQCMKLFECCTADEVMDQTLGAETVEECEEFYAAFIGTLLEPVIQDSVDAGRVEYDGEVLGGCLDVIAAMSCSEFSASFGADGLLAGCGDPFVARVLIEGECANDFDCTSEYCSGDSVDFNTGAITYGTCAVIPGVGEPCDDGECTDAAYCDMTPDVPICAYRLDDGSDCTFDDDCASDFCDDTNLCAVEPPVCDGI
jgi:hypothetical protein